MPIEALGGGSLEWSFLFLFFEGGRVKKERGGFKRKASGSPFKLRRKLVRSKGKR